MKTIIRKTTLFSTASLALAVQLAAQPLPLDKDKISAEISTETDSASTKITRNDALKFAIDEINASGGVLSKQIQPVFKDDNSCELVITENKQQRSSTSITVAKFDTPSTPQKDELAPATLKENELILRPLSSTASEATTKKFFSGKSTPHQSIPTIDYLLEQDFTHFCLVATNSNHSREINQVLSRYLIAKGISIENIIGELTSEDQEVAASIGDKTPWGEISFHRTIQRMKNTTIDTSSKVCILSSLESKDNKTFVTELANSIEEVRTYPVFSFTPPEDIFSHIAKQSLTENQAIWSYLVAMDTVMSTPSPTKIKLNNDFKQWVAQNTDKAPHQLNKQATAKASVINTYNSIYLWKTAVEKTNSFDPETVLLALQQGICFHGAEGTVTTKGKISSPEKSLIQASK